MKPLIVNIKQIGRSVAAYVAQQPNELRGVGRICYTGPWNIRSCTSPEIFGTILYVRGNKRDRDYVVVHEQFTTWNRADDWIDGISEVISRFNKLSKAKRAGRGRSAHGKGKK